MPPLYLSEDIFNTLPLLPSDGSMVSHPTLDPNALVYYRDILNRVMEPPDNFDGERDRQYSLHVDNDKDGTMLGSEEYFKSIGYNVNTLEPVSMMIMIIIDPEKRIS